MLDTSPASLRLPALPKLLAQPAALRNGVVLIQALKRGRVPVHTGIEPIEIEGSAEAGVSASVSRTARAGSTAWPAMRLRWAIICGPRPNSPISPAADFTLTP